MPEIAVPETLVGGPAAPSAESGAPSTEPGAPTAEARAECSVSLWWIPVGHEFPLMATLAKGWERLRALKAGRSPRELLHVALEVQLDSSTKFVIELVPAGFGPARTSTGVVGNGPILSRALGWMRMFQYEIRRWKNGVVEAKDKSTRPPSTYVITRDQALQIIDGASRAPRHPWGQDVLGNGDMWNSNSLVSFVLVSAGMDPAAIEPPASADWPGWDTGVALARTNATLTLVA